MKKGRSELEQGRAAEAYKYVEKAAQDLSKKKEYKAYVKKMPMLIKTNGLGAAVAFAFAKGAKSGMPNPKDPWGLLYKQLESWLREQVLGLKVENKQLAQMLTEVDSATYRAATVEVLALLNWMRRFADALIEGEATDG